jgi:hypothetical protein
MVEKYCLDCGRKGIHRDAIRCNSCSKVGKLNHFYGKNHSDKTKVRIGSINSKKMKLAYKNNTFHIKNRRTMNTRLNRSYLKELSRFARINDNRTAVEKMMATKKKKGIKINSWRKENDKFLSSYELKISQLCIENSLPFIYTGDGTFLIGEKNPDFVNEKDKIAIEVYSKYFKILKYGSTEKYEALRKEYFNEYGFKVIFINEEVMESKKWANLALNLINNGLQLNKLEITNK